jgi:V8-like Glu-specific endopeptidase
MSGWISELEGEPGPGEVVVGRRIARLGGIAVAMAIPLLLMPVSAGAIIGGQTDGGGHPNVGFVAALNAAGALIDGCTGTLVAPKVVLTAAHCIGGQKLGLVDRYVVTFKPVALHNGVVEGGIAGRAYPNARYNLQLDENAGAAAFDRNSHYDVGVLVLGRRADAAYPGIKPAPLPAQGALDGYRTKTGNRPLTHVGYGVTTSGVFDGIRRVTMSPLLKLTNTLLFTEGGICSGDSGGPVFDPRGFVASVANFVEGDCGGPAGGPRLDTGPNRSFLHRFGLV